MPDRDAQHAAWLAQVEAEAAAEERSRNAPGG